MIRNVFFSVTLTSLLAPSYTFAAPTAEEKAQAKQLYQQAVERMHREDYEHACPAFAAASQLDPQHVRTAISLGTCEDRWGKLVSAQQRFALARKLAVEQAAADKIIEIDKLWSDVKRRQPRLKVLVLDRFAKASGMVVVRNGTIVDATELGKVVPLDPGTYEITASSPDTGVWSAKISMKGGYTAEVTIGGAAEAIYRTNQEVDEESLSNEVGSRSNRSGGAYRAVGLTGIGIGAAGIVVGSILGGLAISKNNASDDGHCDVESYCDPMGTKFRLEAQGYGNASTALFAVGGALLVGGIILVATSPSAANSKTTDVSTNLWIGPGSVGIRGTW